MKRQVNEKKLRLTKVTIANLNPMEMGNVKGGDLCPPPSEDNERVCKAETKLLTTSC